MKLELYPYQKDVLDRIHAEGIKKKIIAMDTGTGKTIVGLELVRRYHIKHTLILVKKILRDAVWKVDNDRFFNLPIRVLTGSIMKTFVMRPGVYLTNYELFRVHKEKFQNIQWDVVVLDESHVIGNTGSKVSKAVIGVIHKGNVVGGLKTDRMYLLTGTLLPNRPEQAYPQLRAAGLVMSKTAFDAQFFFTPNALMPWMKIFRENMREAFNNLVSQYCIVVRKDVLALKGTRAMRLIKFDPGLQVAEIIKHVNGRNFWKGAQGIIAIEFPAQKVMVNRQLARGFATVENEYGVKNFVPLDDRPARVFGRLMPGIAEKAIVFYCFNQELKDITGVLESQKRPFFVLNGGLTTNRQNTRLRNFEKSDNGVLVMQYGVGKCGLNLQFCRRMIFYSLDYNNEAWIQAQARIWRNGQNGDVEYYVMYAKGTSDEAVFHSLLEKTDALEALKVWIQNFDPGEGV